MRPRPLLLALVAVTSCARPPEPTPPSALPVEAREPAPEARHEPEPDPIEAAPAVELDEDAPDAQPNDAPETEAPAVVDPEPEAEHAPKVDTAPRSLPIVTGRPERAYDRSDWRHWIDEDGDCQDTRAEVLIEHSRVEVTYTDGRGCRVARGLWLDYYTGTEIREASKIDIDHVVPLANAHRSGAWAWDAEQRRDYANDPRGLLPVSASANRSKGAKGPEAWMPPNRAYRCSYVAHWVAVKAAWGLGYTRAEADAVALELARCGVSGVEAGPVMAAPVVDGGGDFEADDDDRDAGPTCCRYCSKGKPCGDSCIARDKTCRKGRGCACSG